MSTNSTSTRAVTNSSSDTELDSVTIEAGDGYINWIEITKQMLKERERKLMKQRKQTLEYILNDQCKQLDDINSIRVPQYADIAPCGLSRIIDECMDKLYISLSLWNGINLSKTKKSLSTFRKYYIVSKGWFDHKKRTIIGPELWIKCFMMLDRFAKKRASVIAATSTSTDCSSDSVQHAQRLYAQHLLFQIISGVFNAQLLMGAGAKPQPLIPCAMFKESDPIKQYLVQHLDPSLDVDALAIKHSSVDSNVNRSKAKKKKNKKQSVGAKQILQLINKQLALLRNSVHAQLQSSLSSLSTSNPSEQSTSAPSANSHHHRVSTPTPAVAIDNADLSLPSFSNSNSGATAASKSSSSSSASSSAVCMSYMSPPTTPKCMPSPPRSVADSQPYRAVRSVSSSVSRQRFNPIHGSAFGNLHAEPDSSSDHHYNYNHSHSHSPRHYHANHSNQHYNANHNNQNAFSERSRQQALYSFTPDNARRDVYHSHKTNANNYATRSHQSSPRSSNAFCEDDQYHDTRQNNNAFSDVNYSLSQQQNSGNRFVYDSCSYFNDHQTNNKLNRSNNNYVAPRNFNVFLPQSQCAGYQGCDCISNCSLCS